MEAPRNETAREKEPGRSEEDRATYIEHVFIDIFLPHQQKDGQVKGEPYLSKAFAKDLRKCWA
jgi:hypothetical protein